MTSLLLLIFAAVIFITDLEIDKFKAIAASQKSGSGISEAQVRKLQLMLDSIVARSLEVILI